MNNLKYLRIKAGLTQQVLHEKTGIPRSYISALENGRKKLSMKNIIKFARALNVEEKEIEGG